MRRTGMLAALGVLLAMTLAACAGERAGQPPAPVRSNHQVEAIAENMLAAYNLGDYQAFSRDLSLPARLIVDENAFAEFRSENLSVAGPFMVITSVQPEPAKQDPDHIRYRVQAQFQHLNAVALVITLSRDGQVEGLELYPRHPVVRVTAALVVFESMFGNTRQIADAVTEGLAEHLPVELVEVGAAPAAIDHDVELLVVGGPVQGRQTMAPVPAPPPPEEGRSAARRSRLSQGLEGGRTGPVAGAPRLRRGGSEEVVLGSTAEGGAGPWPICEPATWG